MSLRLHQTELGVCEIDDEELTRVQKLLTEAGRGPWTAYRLIYANDIINNPERENHDVHNQPSFVS